MEHRISSGSEAPSSIELDALAVWCSKDLPARCDHRVPIRAEHRATKAQTARVRRTSIICYVVSISLRLRCELVPSSRSHLVVLFAGSTSSPHVALLPSTILSCRIFPISSTIPGTEQQLPNSNIATRHHPELNGLCVLATPVHTDSIYRSAGDI
ncbi:hypothetical protein K466DRAFT_210165 [Polyporus arcularius HHB13444]|uniref:Uncharacterized protein n=1 Tax=Polyporus arcularius HHB13444 TaxID=1314778 RepID=A0A5C3P5A5_9APHY|nr:hypothetical protein K466DRAFT_210165 [Polyporus arcularius HHB13444]